MFYQNGDYEKAAYSYEKGLLYAQRSQHTRLETLLTIGIGDLYAELNDIEIAEQNYARAEKLLEERNDQFLNFSLLIGLGKLALLKGNLKSAAQHIHALEEIIQTTSSHYDHGHFNLLLGKIAIFEDDFVLACKKIEQAEMYFRQDELNLDLISARVWLSAAYAGNGQIQAAVQKIQEALGNKAKHIALIAMHQSFKWLEPLKRVE